MPSWILPLSSLALVFLIIHVVKLLTDIKGQIGKSRDYSEQLKETNELLIALCHVAQGDLCINCGERHRYSEEDCRKQEKELDEFFNSSEGK
jgi:hypothetical protein